MFRTWQHAILTHSSSHSAIRLTTRELRFFNKLGSSQCKLFPGHLATSQKAQAGEILGYRTKSN